MEKVLAFYIRISLEDGDMQDGKEESDSIGNQRSLLYGYVSGREGFAGYSVKEFVDDGYTGRNFDRPGFQELVSRCRAGKVGCIMVKDLSRLGRNYVEVGNLLEQVFPFLGVRVVSVNDGYDSDSFIGQTGGIDVAFRNLVYSLYSRDLSGKTKSAVRTRMKRGEFLGPFAIFGYRKSPEDVHKLVVDEEAAAIVRRIFLMVGSGIPRKEMVEILNEEHVPTPALYKKKKKCVREWSENLEVRGWNATMIANIVHDERYVGHMVAHKKVYESFDSRRQVGVDKAEWIVVRDTHEGIVTQEEFDRANANIRKAAPAKRPHGTKRDFSVIVCPHCGLRLKTGRKRENYMYCFTGRTHKDSPCGGVRIRQDVVEDTLVQLVRKQAQLLLDAEQALVRKKGMKAEGSPDADRAVLERELKRLESEKVSGYERYKAGEITREAFIERKKDLDVRMEQLAASLSEREAQELLEGVEGKKRHEALGITEYLHLEAYDRRVMASLIESAKVMGEDRLEVTWKYQDVYEKILAEARL